MSPLKRGRASLVGRLLLGNTHGGLNAGQWNDLSRSSPASFRDLVQQSPVVQSVRENSHHIVDDVTHLGYKLFPPCGI